MKKIKLQMALLLICSFLLISCTNSSPSKDDNSDDSVISESEETEVLDDDSDSSAWKQAYIDYIEENYDNTWEYIYNLIDINNDDIPELLIDFQSTAGGSVICSFYSGAIIEQHMYNYGLSYIEGENLFMDSGGHMDAYYDKVYSIENDQFALVASGDYGALDNSNVQVNEDGSFDYTYFWNDEEVSETEYYKLLDSIFDTNKSIRPYENTVDYEEIIDVINNY